MKKILSIIFIMAISFMLSANIIFAADTTEDCSTYTDPDTGMLTTDCGPAAVKSTGSSGQVQLPNPLTGTYDNGGGIPVLLGKIINYAMGLVGSLALVMIIYGGITWMLSGGNEQNVTKGKQIVMWAALGLALIFSSYALVKFVISAIGGA
jgi:hypothetical protein